MTPTLRVSLERRGGELPSTSGSWTAPSECEVSDNNPLVAPPTNVTATVQNSNDVQVNWENGENYRDVRVLRNNLEITTLDGDAVSYLDEDLVPGNFVYTIIGVAAVGGDSVGVDAPSVTTLLPPPLNLTCSLSSGNDAELFWENAFDYDNVQVNRGGEEIALLSAHQDATAFVSLAKIREFDENEGWATAYRGFLSCAHWLSWRTGLDSGAAREKVRVAKALGRLALISEAMRRGKISYSKVRALTRIATAENEEELLHFARAGTAAHVERLVRAYRRVDRQKGDGDLEETEVRHASRYCHIFTDDDGMVVIKARLEPESGAAFQLALNAALEVLFERSRDEAEADRAPGAEASAEEPIEQRRADALTLVAEAALKGGLDSGTRGTRGDRYQVVVHVDEDVLKDPQQSGTSILANGKHVSAETARRIACDAGKVVMTHAPDGSVVDVGRKTRTIPPAIRRALDHRDEGCRFPGCGLKFCDAHHIDHWANGGETKLDNLILLCRRHHRALHEAQFKVKRLADGELRFFSPKGRRINNAPTAPGVSEAALSVLIERLAEDGIRIDPMDNLPGWDGRPTELNWAVQWLLSNGDRASATHVSAETRAL